MLKRFADTYREGVPAWQDDSGDAQQRRDRWREACHYVRGALGTLGALALSENVANVERSLASQASRTGQPGDIRVLHQEFSRLVASILALRRG